MDKPVFLVVCDTLSAFHTSMHSENKELTPFLDRLADENIYAPYTYSNAPWTVPSHASIFSGEFPQQHGTSSAKMQFKSESFVEDLGESLAISNNPLVSRELGFDRGFEKFIQGDEVYFRARDLEFPENEGGLFDKLKSVYSEDGFKGVYYSLVYKVRKEIFGDVYADSGLKSTLEILESESDNYSFYFMNLMEPHAPYKAHGWLGKFLNYRKYKLSKEISNSAFPKMGEREAEKVKEQYNREITYLDKNLKDLYEFLESEFDDFTLIITSDHGESFGENGIFDHQYLVSEKLVRVPLIVAGPNISSQRLDSQVSLHKLPKFILSGMKIRDLEASKIKASYQGAINFYDKYSKNFDLESHSQRNRDYLINKSDALIVDKKGLVENSKLEDITFESRINSVGEALEENKKSEIKEKMREENSVNGIDF